MTQSLSPAQQTQMDNRDATGQWKAKAHGDVHDAGGVLGLDGADAGQAAYDALDVEEQQAWHAWREMTGKADETVIGPAKAADIADFKEHYLGSGPEHDIMPDPDAAERAGLNATDDPLSEISTQWSEMVSSGEIEQHQDEDGTFHSFAHPHLLADLDEEDGWEDIEPDFDDHDFSAQDSYRMAGLEGLQHGEVYWDHELASAYGGSGASGALGFNASGSFDDVDTEYLSEETAARVKEVQGSGRELGIAIYAGNSRDVLGEKQQYVSVNLTDAEREAVIADLDSVNGESELNDEIVDYWSAGKPKAMDETFGFVSPSREWQGVSDSVRRSAPEAGKALQVAEELRRDANSAFESEVEHMQTDEWKKDQARARAGL